MNAALVAIVIVIVAITASIITWLITTKYQTPAIISQDKQALQTPKNVPPKGPETSLKNTKAFVVSGTYIKGPLDRKEWDLGPRVNEVYFIADNVNDLPPGSQSFGKFFFSNDNDLFGLNNEVVDNGNGNICGYYGKATIEVSEYDAKGDIAPISEDSAKLNRIVKKEAYTKNCFKSEE